MKYTPHFLLLAMLVLSACGSSHRPTYSGHEESTEGVPGFSKGKKLSPYAKLGQSYTVDGETYVPRHQPGYVEEGLASWYGPGFHGGKTANGEAFDKNEMTGAHRTLPLPSMVRVTMVETGKSAIVRINDRGPFSKGRIIDLSRAAAEKIGLIGKGVAKVRVEYLGPESERFAALMAAGRDPKSIDVEEEVLNSAPVLASNANTPNRYASIPKTTWKDRLSPISSARAENIEYSDETNDSMDHMEVSAKDLAPPAAPATVSRAVSRKAVESALGSPGPVKNTPAAPSTFDVMEQASAEPAPAEAPVAPAKAAVKQPATPPVATGQYFQLGAFANQANAEKLKSKVATIGTAQVEQKLTAENSTLYVVRMGPYTDVEESSRVLAELNGLGINPKPVVK